MSRFEEAVAASKNLPQRPDNDTLLKIYSLYKQATEGNSPEKGDYGAFDFVGKAKFDAWKQLNGLSKEAAENQYIALIDMLKGAR